jgi:hypothetical protein
VAIHITGFGKFAGVALNPTMLIAQKLQRELDDHHSPGVAPPLLRSSRVLEVSAVAVLMELAEIFHAITTQEARLAASLRCSNRLRLRIRFFLFTLESIRRQKHFAWSQLGGMVRPTCWLRL